MHKDGPTEKSTPVIRPLTYILMHADTRCLEFAGGVFCGVWALWLAWNIQSANNVFSHAVHSTGGAQAWSLFAAFNFFMQAVSLYWRWPKMRRIASFCACTYWSWVAWNLFAEQGMFMPWIAVFWAGVQGWILARRVVIGK